MKKLQVEFVSNVDQCGLHTFKQIQRCAGAAIYQRIRKDGTTHSYEAFKIKVIKAGAKLPNGATVAEDYESYPGKSSFGRWAYSCKDLAHAERRYDELLKSQVVVDDVEEDDDEAVDKNKQSKDTNTVKGKRGRKAKNRANLKIPKDKFTMKQLELMNSDFSFAFLYQHVRALLNIEFKIVESLGGKRGKPTIVYAPIDYPT